MYALMPLLKAEIQEPKQSIRQMSSGRKLRALVAEVEVESLVAGVDQQG